jgi:hypothetical protein
MLGGRELPPFTKQKQKKGQGVILANTWPRRRACVDHSRPEHRTGSPKRAALMRRLCGPSLRSDVIKTPPVNLRAGTAGFLLGDHSLRTVLSWLVALCSTQYIVWLLSPAKILARRRVFPAFQPQYRKSSLAC